MAVYKAQIKSDEVSRTEHICKFCGGWINKGGLLDDKHRTSNAVYCSFCNTAAKRQEQDKENSKILKERNGK